MLILQKRPRITPWSSVISVPNGCTAPALALAFNTSQMLVRPSCVVPRQQKTMTFSEPYNLRSFYISSFIYRVVNVQKGNKKAVLRFTDVFTLYPNKGVSDAIINFFVRYVMYFGSMSLLNITYLGSCSLIKPVMWLSVH